MARNSTNYTYTLANSGWKTIALEQATGYGYAKGDDLVADSATDTLTLSAGPNITLINDPATDTISISAAGGGGGGGGKILQVLNNSNQPGTISDTSYTAAVSQAITLADSGNKVLITAAANFGIGYDDMNYEDGDLRWKLYRGGTAIGTEQHFVNNDDMNYYWKYYGCVFTFLDSPGTTNATTYSLKYYHANSAGPADASIFDAMITVQEVS
tara:strand:+ start:911 stop:1549 length:639 start_codon:yes stop_codon:yes gene_type:complete